MTDPLILFDQNRTALLPLTFSRPVGAIRIGILTISEKWEQLGAGHVRFLSQDYFNGLYPNISAIPNDLTCLFVPGNLLPTPSIRDAAFKLKDGEILESDGQIIAIRTSKSEFLSFWENTTDNLNITQFSQYTSTSLKGAAVFIRRPFHIFQLNEDALSIDFDLLTRDKTSAKLSSTNTHIGSSLFIEDGAIVEGAILNSTKGPIYIGKNAEVMEGSVIRGPFAMGESATLKMGTRIYGATTLGPHCKAGGEISNSVMFGYSNKGHDGFLGNSVIGEWCNLGADTNTSNLKNNYSEVRAWNYGTRKMENTGLQFHGLVMGDHSKCGINTMFNTGTTAGFAANIFDSGFPPKHIPSFAWGGAQGFTTFRLEKSFEMARAMMSRRKIAWTSAHERMFTTLFEQTAKDRDELFE